MTVRETTLKGAADAMRAAWVVLTELRGRYQAEDVIDLLEKAMRELDADRKGA